MIAAYATFQPSFFIKRIRCVLRGHEFSCDGKPEAHGTGHLHCERLAEGMACSLEVRHLHSVTCVRCASQWVWCMPP